MTKTKNTGSAASAVADTSSTEERVRTLLEQARQTVKPAVLREREAEKINQDLLSFRMSGSNSA